MNPAATPAIPALQAFSNRRLAREWKTVVAMIRIFCRDRHGGHVAQAASLPYRRLPSRHGVDCSETVEHSSVQTRQSAVQQSSRLRYAKPLCPECQALTNYVHLRLDRCRFGEEKPTCAKCPVHCYQKERRDQIKEVMRYAGPKMLWEHPWLSLCHLLDGWFRTAPNIR